MKETIYKPIIRKFNDVTPFEIHSGVYFHDMVTKEMGPKTIVAGLATFKPNAGLPRHIHNVEEAAMILKGSGIFDIDGERTFVQPYDTCFIPAGIPHRLENASNSDELVISWFYSQIDETFKPVDIERIQVASDRRTVSKQAVKQG
ncbi:cupin domain-containing protein [Paenibacillus tarimensis]